MNTSIVELTQKIAAQAARLPTMYGRVDFSVTPERFTVEPDAQTVLDPESSKRRAELLANEERVARIKAYTMLGDLAADSYAALMPEYGFRGLVTMLEEACDHGLEKVQSAPLELVRLIREMERLRLRASSTSCLHATPLSERDSIKIAVRSLPRPWLPILRLTTPCGAASMRGSSADSPRCILFQTSCRETNMRQPESASGSASPTILALWQQVF
jgi:hypothetical protein